MKKNSIIGLIIVIITVGGVISFLLLGRDDGILPTSTSQESSETSLDTVKACDILTKDVVTEMIGDNLTDTNPASAEAVGNDILVTNCTYTTKADASSIPVKISGANLLVRSAQTIDGSKSNEDSFTTSRPTDAQDIDGYGDSAFYSSQYRQLNVLKGNNWYILTVYKDNITNTTVELTTEMAQKLEFK
jgi:hypothetical protein